MNYIEYSLGGYIDTSKAYIWAPDIVSANRFNDFLQHRLSFENPLSLITKVIDGKDYGQKASLVEIKGTDVFFDVEEVRKLISSYLN